MSLTESPTPAVTTSKAPRSTTSKAPGHQPFRAGLVAVVGRANVGKSTLVNRLVDYRLSAVSPKPQTTRHRVLGIVTGEHHQVALFDTPGVAFRTADNLDRRLLTAALGAIQEANLAVLMVECRTPGDIEMRIMQELGKDHREAILAINKIDRGKKELLLPVMEQYSGLYPFLEIVPLSALNGDGLDDLLRLMVQHLPKGEALFGPDEITDRSERFLATEIVREQVFNAYAQEVPYAVAVEIEDFREASEEHRGKDYISAVLYAERDSQKGILIGSGGQMLKAIGTAARGNIERLLDRRVHLELWVKVYPRWRRDPEFLERIGY